MTPPLLLHERSSDLIAYKNQARPAHKAYVRVPPPSFPESAFQDDQPRRRGMREGEAVDDILELYPPISDNTDEYVSITLNDFEIYRPRTAARDPLTLASLNELLTYPGDDRYSIDGSLSFAGVSHYIQDIPFETLTLDGYGSSNFLLSAIHIQSRLNRRSNIFYELGSPAARYTAYHQPFIWLATFCKHFFEYLDEAEDRSVCLRDFESDFFVKLWARHGQSQDFQKWHAQFHNSHDFRQIVAVHHEFLWKETTNISDDVCKHMLWREVDVKQVGAIPFQVRASSIAKTLVTAFIWTLFKDMYFGHHLEIVPADPNVLRLVQKRADAMNLSVVPHPASLPDKSVYQARDAVKQGDVIMLDRDEDGVWQDEASMWYAYVQAVRHDHLGAYLELIWLYRPSETVIDRAFYPMGNELFFSDHCNCEDGRVRLDEVKGTLPVEFCERPRPNAVAFIRQMYVT